MALPNEIPFCPADFSGIARLFPLPDHVMFPHVVQPFHIFEDRYRALMASALRDDKLITIVQLAGGWESADDADPPIAEVGCLGKILTHVRLEDGRYNLMLAGLRRVRIVRELEPRHEFREAHVELLEDFYPGSGADVRQANQKLLLQRFRAYLPQVSESHQKFDELLEGPISLGMLTDLVACFVNLDATEKQQLLNQVNVDLRMKQLLETLEGSVEKSGSKSFPPQFSLN